mgnify:CR=1 FL=1
MTDVFDQWCIDNAMDRESAIEAGVRETEDGLHVPAHVQQHCDDNFIRYMGDRQRLMDRPFVPNSLSPGIISSSWSSKGPSGYGSAGDDYGN